MQRLFYILIAMSLVLGMFHSCYDVEEGYRITYSESSAQLTVETIGLNRGAIGDTIKLKINALTSSSIKALSVTSTVSGAGGTGYIIPQGGNDPFIDHTYGTIKENTTNIDVYYYYIVSQDTLKSNLTFKLIDEEGEKIAKQEIITVHNIVKYNDITMYTFNNTKADGFSTDNGVVYHYLPTYEPVTVANNIVQESLDMIFIVEGSNGMLVSPYDGHYYSSMQIRNKTKFKKVQSLAIEDFDQLTAAALSLVIDSDTVKNGSTYVSDLKVNDIVGFQTDFASANSYNYGLLKVNAIHPTNSEWYEGVSYVIVMDVITQK